VAALSVTGTTNQLPFEAIDQVAHRLRKTAAMIGAPLPHSPSAVDA
jgi:DNA-binding IclR family transcriptional regulator